MTRGELLEEGRKLGFPSVRLSPRGPVLRESEQAWTKYLSYPTEGQLKWLERAIEHVSTSPLEVGVIRESR